MTAADKSVPLGAPGCNRCALLRNERDFWRDQQKLAANMAASLADLNDYDGRVAALRQLLAAEIERRKRAEQEVAVLSYRLAEATRTLP